MTTRKMTKMDRYKRSINNNRETPEIINPFRELREESNYTLEELARLIGISKQAIIRTEQGTYVDVPSRIIEWYSGHYSLDYVSLGESYRDYQREIRSRHKLLFGIRLRDIITEKVTESPHVYDFRTVHPFNILKANWINPETNEPYAGVMNTTEFAKLLCVPQGTLDYFENKVTHQASVPNILCLALRENGYSSQDIQLFCDAYTTYRNVFLGKTASPVGSPSYA